MAGTTAIGAVVRLPATVIEEVRDPSSTSGILADADAYADTDYLLLSA
ncbi:hypothetical protein [Streptomyces piniterrae]|nr:hypothetical protein [Streptomyces piniterrae]